ncbi:MAG TPA: hypothetical protein VH593_25330 [Ktedonobacteraceae bacterium]|jgi:hypothetical protein
MSEMSYAQFFECQESIYRGDECLACGAKWDGHALDHAEGCAYLTYIDKHADGNDPAACDLCGRTDDHEHDWEHEFSHLKQEEE